jgi:hypothetical protein
MSSKDITAAPLTAPAPATAPGAARRASLRGMLLCIAAMVACTLVSAAPLNRLAGETFLLSLPTNPALLMWGSWLPFNGSTRASMITTNDCIFILLMALAFFFYALGARHIARQPHNADCRRLLRLTWCAGLVIGLIYVCTPALLSRDIFVYAGYGRLIVAHHANPYFVVATAFPLDPLVALDDWANATSAYGPFWLAICAAWSQLAGAAPLAYLFALRLFELGAHLLNILLVAAILRGLGRSSRTIALGAFLYALNPLILMESGLGGHNDIFMLSLLLTGMLLCLRAEQMGFVRPAYYLPPILAFTLAALVKFVVAPVILFYLVLMASRVLRQQGPGALIPSRGSAAWLRLLVTGAAAGLLALICYTPFWIGHSGGAIIGSFSTPPSAYFAQNSILRAIYNAGAADTSSWSYLPLSVLGQHRVWNAINLLTLSVCAAVASVCLWRSPRLQTLMLASVATLGALLLVTPWFFAWYVIWLVALVCACWGEGGGRAGRALSAFALTFSFSALTTYFFRGYPPIGDWSGIALPIMYVPPLLACWFFFQGADSAGWRTLRGAGRLMAQALDRKERL